MQRHLKSYVPWSYINARKNVKIWKIVDSLCSEQPRPPFQGQNASCQQRLVRNAKQFPLLEGMHFLLDQNIVTIWVGLGPGPNLGV